ncbi:MAG: TRL-like family protein [Bacteroidales bacterium]|nr:TRL-like family protein [Bacteroidales bacterium]
MKKLRNSLLGLAVAGLMLLSSCSIVVPVTATSNPVGSKVGTSKATVYLGFLALDQDASIQTAAKNGGISKISTVDQKQGNVLGLIWTFETIVTGN